MALVGAQVITGIAAKVPVVGQRMGPERKREQQDSVPHEPVQGPFKEVRLDQGRPNNQGLTSSIRCASPLWTPLRTPLLTNHPVTGARNEAWIHGKRVEFHASSEDVPGGMPAGDAMPNTGGEASCDRLVHVPHATATTAWWHGWGLFLLRHLAHEALGGHQ